jgi:hypothetical protein
MMPLQDIYSEIQDFKVPVHDRSPGRMNRQHRETDYAGTLPEANSETLGAWSVRTMKSAFDHSKQYELTALGQQFVYYAMTKLSLKVPYTEPDEAEVSPEPTASART